MPTGVYTRTKKQSPETIQKRIDTRRKLGYKPPSHKGKVMSQRQKDNISKGRTNNPKVINALLGHTCSPETRKKISDAQKGDKSIQWKGGISYQPYPDDWNETLRNSIRQRDNLMCQECGVHQDELTGRFKKLEVHHIDYNKDNLDPDNLISLCKSCHTKTNINREYWINYFK